MVNHRTMNECTLEYEFLLKGCKEWFTSQKALTISNP